MAAAQNAAVDFRAAPEFRGVARFRVPGRSLRAALTFALSAFLITGSSAAELEPWTGGAKPIFALDRLDGPRTDLAALRGRIVLVHFFATWCGPCVTEIAALNRLAVRLAGKPLDIVAVDAGEVEARVRTFARENDAVFPILLDRDRAVMKDWAIEGLPTTFVLGADLVPVLVAHGDADWDRPDINSKLTELINTLDAPVPMPAVSK